MECGKRLNHLPEADCKLLAASLAQDIDDARNGIYYGYLFGGTDSNSDSPFVEKPWWVHRDADLRFIGNG